jgi:SAM-dependent methyltransferase
MRNKIISDCPICGSNQIKKMRHYNGKTSFFKDKKNKILGCSNCGLAFIYPMPTKLQLDQYYSSYWCGEDSVQSSSEESLRVYKAEMYSRCEFLLRKTGTFKNYNILDFGSGHGLFKEVILEKEKEFNYYAVEADVNIVNQLISKGVNAATKIEAFKNTKYDIIVVFHVLEHLSNSKEFIAGLLKHLKKEGILFIEIPNQDYLWKNKVEPHVLFFNKMSLEALFNSLEIKKYNIVTCGRKLQNIPNERKKGKKIRRIVGKILRRFGLIKEHGKEIKSPIDYKTYRKIYKMDEFGESRQWIRAIIIKD